MFWIFGWGFTTRPPACAKCALLIRAQRLGGAILTLLFAVLFMVFVWPLVDGFVAPSLRSWTAMGMMLVCFSPYFLWETFFPPAIDITAYKKSVDYEFKNRDYAFEFAELNRDAEWVHIHIT